MTSSPPRSIIHPITGKTFKLGRNPSPPMRHLRLGDYLKVFDLPEPPPVCHYSPLVEHGLAMVLGNDTAEDCAAAAAGHMIDLWRGNAGMPTPVITEAETIAFYSRTCGYVPGDPSTDRGGNLVDVMRQWQSGGFMADGSAKISGWASVDAANKREVMIATWLMEGLYMGAGLPDKWLAPMPAETGFVWDVAGDADQRNGHCTATVGYNGLGVQIDTWGMIGTITWPALAKYWAPSAEGELYALLSPDAISRATKKAPNGFDLAALTADLAELQRSAA